MSVSFGTLQNANFKPIYELYESPSMCELFYFLKKLYNYEPGLIHIIKQLIFTKRSPLNQEYISIWEVYAFYFNYQLTEIEYVRLCNDNTITRFWSNFPRSIHVIDRHSGTLIRTWHITYKHLNLVYDYCKQYYLNNHNSRINNYKTLIRLKVTFFDTKIKIKQQEHLIEKQELDYQLIDKSITKDEYETQLTKLIVKKENGFKENGFISIEQKTCSNVCENIRAKILSIKKKYDTMDTNVLCLI